MDEVTYEQLVDKLKERGFKQYPDPTREADSSWYLRVPEHVAPLDLDGRKQQLLVHVYKPYLFPNKNEVDATVVVAVNGNVHSKSGEIILSGFSYWDVMHDVTFSRISTTIWVAWRALVAYY